MADLACVYARTGEKEKAEELLGRLKSVSKETYVPPYNLAQLCACLDRKDEAFDYLENVLDERFGVFLLRVDPLFDKLRPDPRFTALLRKAHLTD
jgi:hypothetical protein